MFLALKEVIIITVSIVTAVFAGFGFLPDAAFAPEDRPPAKIVFEFPNKGEEATETPKESPEAVQEAPSVNMDPVEVGAETPVAPEVDPFTELAEALAQLAEESTTPLETQTPVASTNDIVRGALVNIICTTETAGPVNPISGSGVIIDPRGIILTNAHVAQFFLLENYPRPGFIDCYIRTGSPATAKYTAELMFLPPSWIKDNAQKIDDAAPTGNGEHDWALVGITGTISDSIDAPSTFSYLPVSLNTPSKGDQVLVAGYPAGFLGGITVAKELYAASANAQIKELYTFGSQSIDLFSIGGSIVAQQGSSGGAAATPDGILTGVIVTSTSAPDTASRDLRAIATRYIVEDFASETGISLSSYLGGNLAENTLAFRQNIFPTLAAALISVLEK